MGSSKNTNKAPSSAPRKEIGSSSRSRTKSQTRKEKGKSLATEPEIEFEAVYEEVAEEDCESDSPVMATRVTRKKPKTKPPPYSEYLRALMAVPFVQTRFADESILQELGIFEDVAGILANMGMRNFHLLDFPAFQIPTCEFLASLTIHVSTKADRSPETLGHIKFRVGGKVYKMEFSELSAIYGFSEGEWPEFRIYEGEPNRVWDTIGVGKYNTGLTKGSQIRHPAIRYVHKLLAHTFFARRETGAITNHEMTFLINGVKPLLQYCRADKFIHGGGATVSMAIIFVVNLMKYKDWARTTTDKSPTLSIGGVITPILMAKGINLGEYTGTIPKIDAAYLTAAHFLGGRVGEKYIYKCSLSKSKITKIPLPQPEITNTERRRNVFFEPSPEYFYDAKTMPKITPLWKTKQGKGHQATHAGPSDEDASQPPSPVYGSARYHFEPYDEPISSNAVRHAHEHISLLQRVTKWQGRTIKKLARSMKSLKKDVKNLKSRFTGSSSTQVPEDGAEHEDMECDRRQSFHGTPSASLTLCEPPRASSYERGTRKRRARRSPTPSSSNPSLSLSSMDSSGSTHF